MKKLSCIVALGLILGSVTSARAEPTVTKVLGGLDNPCGVALQPETGAIFVSDSAAGRVIKVGPDGAAQDVITGFPQDIYGKGPKYNIGPLGLAFIDKSTLVVGGGGLPDGEELLRIYRLPEDGKAITADQMKASFSLPKTDEIQGEGNFYAIVVTSNGIFATSNGDDTKGWVAKCEIKGDDFGPYQRFIATKEAVEVDAPVGITTDARGNLVVGQMGEINVPSDSLLTFYNAKDGQMRANFPTQLHDITAVAYNPQNGRLFALDFAWLDVTQGGLFELVAAKEGDRQTVKATKVQSLMKPSAMAFDSEGVLYVTVFGETKEGEKTGELLRIEL